MVLGAVGAAKAIVDVHRKEDAPRTQSESICSVLLVGEREGGVWPPSLVAARTAHANGLRFAPGATVAKERSCNTTFAFSKIGREREREVGVWPPRCARKRFWMLETLYLDALEA